MPKNTTDRISKSTQSTNITGIRPAMVQFSMRVPKDEADIAHSMAKLHKCYAADFLRTAWTEYIANHNLREVLAEAKAKRKSKAK